jgi:hypothetical protein
MRPVEIPPSEQAPSDTQPSGAGHETSAADDLADGLDLMLRAARKALRSLDPRIEEAGRRALERLEEFDASALGEMGRRAAASAKVDVDRLERAAQEAGREISSVVERLAERIEAAFSDRPSSSGSGGAEPPKQ